MVLVLTNSDHLVPFTRSRHRQTTGANTVKPGHDPSYTNGYSQSVHRLVQSDYRPVQYRLVQSGRRALVYRRADDAGEHCPNRYATGCTLFGTGLTSAIIYRTVKLGLIGSHVRPCCTGLETRSDTLHLLYVRGASVQYQ